MKKAALFTLLFLGSLTQAMDNKQRPNHAACVNASIELVDVNEMLEKKNYYNKHDRKERISASLYCTIEYAATCPQEIKAADAPEIWKYITGCTQELLLYGADVNLTRRYNGPTVLDLLYEAYGEEPSADIAPLLGLLKSSGAKRGTELEKAKAVADRVEEKS